MRRLKKLWALLRVRLIVVFTAIALITFLLSGFSLYRSLDSRLQTLQNNLLTDRLDEIQARLEDALRGGETLDGAVSQLILSPYRDFGLLVYSADGRLQNELVPLSLEVGMPNGPQIGVQTTYRGENGDRFTAASIELEGGQGVITVFASLAPYDAVLNELYPEVQTALISSLVAIIGAGVFIGSNISRVLGEIEVVAKAVAQGEFDRRVRIRGQDEVGRLALTVNEMASKLHALSQAQAQFFGKISHELRTPLTIVKGFAITLQRQGNLDPSMQRQLNIINQQTDHLTRLVDDLLDLARSDVGKLAIHPEEIDLVGLSIEMTESFQVIAVKQGLSLTVERTVDNLPVSADPQRIQQVISILLDNALKYAPEKGQIKVLITSSDGMAHVAVEDNGPGIPEASLSRIFDRFYQTDNNRGGVGLGLSVAKELVEAHGGKIIAVNCQRGGCCFRFSLPLLDEIEPRGLPQPERDFQPA